MSIKATASIQGAGAAIQAMAAAGTASHMERLPLAAFAEQYQVREEIGSGKFAVVKRCVKNDNGGGRKSMEISAGSQSKPPPPPLEVAAKFIRKSRSARFGQKTEDIELEIDIVSRLAPHQNIIQLMDVFEDVTQVILVFELMKGGELQDYIADYERLTEPEARLFMRQILSALVHLHEKSIVHLDLKPENILLTEEGSRQIKLIDFGISRQLHEKADIKGVYGTPEFIAPEILNYEPIGYGTDLWSVGCIAYTMLYGSSPFLGVDKHDTFANITAATFDFADDDLPAGTKAVSSEARDFIVRCLRKDIRKRMTAQEAMTHPWVVKEERVDVDSALSSTSSSKVTYNSSAYDHCDEEDDEITFEVALKASTAQKGSDIVRRPSSLGNSSAGTPTNGSTTPTSTTSVGSGSEICESEHHLEGGHEKGVKSPSRSTGRLDSAVGFDEPNYFSTIRQRWKRSIRLVILHNRHQKRKMNRDQFFKNKKKRSPPQLLLDEVQTADYHHPQTYHHHHHHNSHHHHHHHQHFNYRNSRFKAPSVHTFYSKSSSSSTLSSATNLCSHSLSSGSDTAAKDNDHHHLQLDLQSSEDKHDENFLLAALFGAIEEGNLHSIEELLAASAIDPNQCNKHGESLLHYCAGLGQLEIFKFLCQMGADLNVIDDQEDTVIHWAARQNQPSIIRYIYEQSLSIETINKNLETPLHVAARYGHVEAVEQLCKCGAKINAIDEHGETAILIAVWHGFPKIVQILGDIGADTNIRNKEDETALHVASARGHFDCVRVLLEAGANANLYNKHFYTPLHLALKRQHSTVAMALLRSGADYELEDSAGDRAIHYVARHNLVAVCQWLTTSLSSSTSLNSSSSSTTATTSTSTGNSSPSANSTATSTLSNGNSSSSSTSALLQPRCAVNSPNKSGLYPLHIAAKSGHIEIVRMLCLAGSTIDPKDHDSMVPQICAIAQSHNDIADLLTRLLNGRQKVEEYIGQLSAIGQPPLSRCKLRVFGHCGAGKSTLIESMKCGYFSSWFRRSKATVVPVVQSNAGSSGSSVNAGYGVFSSPVSLLRSKQGSISSLRASATASPNVGGLRLPSSVIQSVSGQIARTFEAVSPSGLTPASTPTPQLLSQPATPVSYENATKGIDVQQLYISGGGIGDLSVWEFSGNPVYYQLYDHFLATDSASCLNAVVFRLSDPPEVQLSSVTFWLAFIASRTATLEPLLYGGRSCSSSRVMLVATHADLASREMTEPEMAAHLRWLLEAVNRRFWTLFSIHPTVFMMDASVAGSAGMKALKAHLSAAKTSVLASPELPRSTRFLDSALTFLNLYRKASANFPVLSGRLFKEMIRSQINPLASEDHFRELLQQLIILGEVVYLRAPSASPEESHLLTSNSCDKNSASVAAGVVVSTCSSVSSSAVGCAFSDDDQLVLCPQWLTSEIIGTLLLLKCNPSSYLSSGSTAQLNVLSTTQQQQNSPVFNSNRINGIYSIDEFQELYTDVDALDLLQLLESLQLCTQNDRSGDIEYEFPCFILAGDLEAALESRFQYRENAVYHGLVYSRAGSGVSGSSKGANASSGTILSSIFPRIQAALRTELRHHPRFDVDELQNCFKYSLFSTCSPADLDLDTDDSDGSGKLHSQSLVMIVSVDTVADWIELRFCGPYESRREVFFFAAEMTAIIERKILEVAPGLLLRKAYFSPEQLKNSSPKETTGQQLSLYSSATLMRAMLLMMEGSTPQKSSTTKANSTTSTSTSQLLKRKVRTDDGLQEERLADVLTFGIVNLAEIGHPLPPGGNGSSTGTVIEPTLVHELHSSNLSVLTKQQLCSLLDPPESIGRDWCMLGILLGMTDKLPKLDTTPTPTSAGNSGGGFSWPKEFSSSAHVHPPSTLSPTARVIEECIRNPACTIRTLVEKLTELNRTDAVEVILQTGPLLRIHPLASLPEEGAVYNDESSSHTSHSLGISTSMSHTSSSNLSR